MDKTLYKIKGQSMLPILIEGMILLVDNKLNKIKPGDIICFKSKTGSTITHRYYFSFPTPTGTKCIEWGDNCKRPTLISKKNIINRVTGVIDKDKNKITKMDELMPYHSIRRIYILGLLNKLDKLTKNAGLKLLRKIFAI